MKIDKTTGMLHPILIKCVKKIQTDIIDSYNIPMRIFETGRDHERQQILLNKGKTKDVLSKHLYDLENDPPLYATAIDYTYYDGKRWSWNLRDSTIMAWYALFGNLVLDICPELQWQGTCRKSINYTHFELRNNIMINNLDIYPCVTS